MLIHNTSFRIPSIARTMLVMVGFVLFPCLTQAAVTISQWNFNSVPPDGLGSTGTTLPSIGGGTASLVVSSGAFADGNADGGSSDPTVADDSGWNLAGFATQGTGNQTRGAQWMVDTTGYGSISVSFDQRNSPTASRFWAVHYTLNSGTSWIPFSVSGSNTNAGLFEITAGDTWFNGLAIDFSSVTGADNNPLFGLRLLSSFAPSTSSYSPTSGGSYGTSGTARFDMVTFNGNVIPEPSRALLMAFGLSFTLSQRRRQAA